MPKATKKHRSHILVAEDDRTHQRFVEEMLQQMGFDTTIVTNGQMAVDLLKSRHFDLVLMDCNMPLMSGYEAARIISGLRTDGSIADIPVIALTANQREGDAEKCFEAGMDDYIAKSLWLPKWKPRIERIIDKWIASAGKNGKKQDGVELVSAVTLARAQDLAGKKFSALVSLYLSDSKQRIDRMKSQAQDKKQADETIIEAYNLMSASKQIGAVQMAHMASEIARHASVLSKRNDDCGALMAQVVELEALYEETRSALQDSVNP